MASNRKSSAPCTKIWPAIKHFDVFVTVDRNFSYQQNLGAFRIAIVVLRAYPNRMRDL
jgi:hypothetical protein